MRADFAKLAVEINYSGVLNEEDTLIFMLSEKKHRSNELHARFGQS